MGKVPQSCHNSLGRTIVQPEPVVIDPSSLRLAVPIDTARGRLEKQIGEGEDLLRRLMAVDLAAFGAMNVISLVGDDEEAWHDCNLKTLSKLFGADSPAMALYDRGADLSLSWSYADLVLCQSGTDG